MWGLGCGDSKQFSVAGCDTHDMGPVEQRLAKYACWKIIVQEINTSALLVFQRFLVYIVFFFFIYQFLNIIQD